MNTRNHVRVTIREVNTYTYEFIPFPDSTEDQIIDEAMWLHTDPHLVRQEPDSVGFLSASVEYVKDNIKKED